MWYTSRSHALQYFELFKRIFFPLFPIQRNELTQTSCACMGHTIWTLHCAVSCIIVLLIYSILSVVVLHSQLESVLRTSCCHSSLVWSHPGWSWPCETISADSLDTRLLHVQQSGTSLVTRPSNARTSPTPQLRKRGNEEHAGRVWQKTMPGSVLTVGMLPDVLMRERMSVQPTSVRVRLMTGNKYTVEHRNFENWSSKGPIVLKI